jgi:transcriptional regulator with XRE-family HTH domain
LSKHTLAFSTTPQIYSGATMQITNDAIILKKMRLLRRLNRQEAALLFNCSHNLIEKLENGRGRLSIDKFRDFQQKYGFSDNEIEELRAGKIEAPTDANSIRKKITTDKRLNKRFRHRRITRECKVLKELRLRINLDQTKASLKCGFGKNNIGFIENGRITLTEDKIRHIVESYGFTMELYYQLLKVTPLPHELREDCQSLINKLDENKLRIIMPMLQSMATN